VAVSDLKDDAAVPHAMRGAASQVMSCRKQRNKMTIIFTDS